jgi:hypothetical protein
MKHNQAVIPDILQVAQVDLSGAIISPSLYRHTQRTVGGRLSSDLDWIEKSSFRHLVFDDVDGLYGEKMTRFLNTWPEPSTTALIMFAAGQLGFDNQSPYYAALMTSGVLADIENTLPFHGNAHYKKVLIQTLRQITTHNAQAPDTARYTDRQIALMMMAAALHDLVHDGRGNGVGDTHIPFRLEQQSVDAALPYLKMAGLSADDLLDLETVILCTDVTPFSSPDAPAAQLKRLYAHNIGAQSVGVPALHPRLARLANRPDLVAMAMVLETADIAPSAGLSFEQGMKESRYLAAETGVTLIATINTYQNFIGSIGRVVTQTPAGQKIFGAGYNTIQMECRKQTAGPSKTPV